MRHKFPFPQGHSSFITHVDWSKDSRYLITNSGDYEILFCTSSCHLHQRALDRCSQSPTRLTFVCKKNGTWGLFTTTVETLSGEAPSGKHVTNMDTVRNVEWATSTCTLSFNTFGGLMERRLPLSPCAASTSPFLTQTQFWLIALPLLSQESGQKEQTAQTSMPCAGHMAAPCWPLLMTLAKCTCFPSPAAIQGSVMFAHTLQTR